MQSVHQRRLFRLGWHVLLVPGLKRCAATAGVALLAGLAAWAARAGTVPVELALAAARPLDEGHVAGNLVAEAGSRRLEWRIHAPGRAEIALDDGVGWRLWVEAPGWWCEPAVVVPELARGVVLRLLPAGELRVCVEPAATAPSQGTARATPTPEAFAPPGLAFGDAEVSCPGEEGCYRCALPAGVLDVRLGIEGWAPVYLWGVVLTAQELTEVGPVALRSGASVSGLVTGFERSGDVRVTLAPTGDAPAGGSQALMTGINDRGFFQFTAVAPGTYAVQVAAPGRRAQSGEVAVSPGLESRLDTPLRLASPATLRVVLEPRGGLRDAVWRVSLHGDPGRGGPENWAVDRDVGAEMALTFPELLAGTYRLSVRDAAGTVWAIKAVDVQSGHNAVVVPLAGIRCRGVLRIRGEKTAGQLLLSGDGRGTTLVAEDDGRFEGVVPGEGRYRALVRPGRSGGAIEAGHVEVPGPGEPCELDIDLAGGRLEGTVERANGTPVAGASVRAVRLGADGVERASARSDRAGSFVFDGLAEGRWVLEATWRGEWSEPLEVEVTGHAEGEPLHLVVRDADEFSGRVVSSRGPLTGALVRAMPRRADVGQLFVAEARSDLTGAFTVRMMGRAPMASLVLAAPGFGLELLAAGPQRRLGDVALSPDGGVLQVAGNAGCPQLSCLAGLWLVRGAARWPLGALLEAAGRQAEGGEVLLAPLAPGPWSVCWGDPASLFSALDAGLPAPPGACVGGLLAPRGLLRLVMGREAAAER